METRRAALTNLNRVVNSHPEYCDRHSTPATVRNKLTDFTDDTLILLNAAVKEPLAGELVTYRMIKFLCSYQHHGVEAVVRNIAIFTKEEKPYIESLGIKWDDRWKVFAFTESRVRLKVTGVKLAVTETAAQRADMVAVFHAYFSMSVNYIHNRGYSASGRYTPYSVNKAMESFKGDESVDHIIDFFITHKEEVSRLTPFVVDRGVVAPAILENFLEHEAALSSGVL